MRVCVCGLGKVGKPLLEMLRSKGITALGYDVNPEISEVPLKEAVKKSDAALFVVPTPSLPDGSFSNDHLISALSAFEAMAFLLGKKASYVYIVVSTTVPGSCDRFRQTVGDHICYKPEFIRLEHVHADLLAPSFVLVGAGSDWAGDACETLYRRVTSAPIKRMSLIEAELAKITLNCALTMKISLANQLWMVAKQVGADPEKIMDAVGTDPRIGNAYLAPGAPYGGPCLPRDNGMFRYFAKTVGVEAYLSTAADAINEALK